MDETKIIIDFLESLKGVRDYDGQSKCKVIFTYGNGENVTENTTIEDCIFDCEYIRDMVNVTLTPKQTNELYPIDGAIRSYMAKMQRSLKIEKEPEDLYMIFAPNEEYWDAYVVMVNPIWWGFVSKTPMEKANSVRLLFQAQNVVYQSVEDVGDQNTEKATQESEDFMY